jgi:hypothetical protein
MAAAGGGRGGGGAGGAGGGRGGGGQAGSSGAGLRPSSHDYGRETPGESASQRFTLTNSGHKATGRLKVTLSGAAAFTATRDTCTGTRLRPGRSCVVRVRFTPAGAATVTATLTAADTKGRVTATAALSGSGMLLGSVPGHLYWADGDSIWAANLDGSNPQTLVTAPKSLGVAVAASRVYWSDNNDATINVANLDGSNPRTLVSSPTGLPAGVAVDASHLYWTNAAGRTVNQANLDGTGAHAIIGGQSSPVGVAVSS